MVKKFVTKFFARKNLGQFCLGHGSSSWAELRLHTENYLHMYSGSALKYIWTLWFSGGMKTDNTAYPAWL